MKFNTLSMYFGYTRIYCGTVRALGPILQQVAEKYKRNLPTNRMEQASKSECHRTNI